LSIFPDPVIRTLRRLSSGSRREQGQALVEFGLVAVAFLLLSFGVFDLARLFQSWVTVQHASRESARYAITGRMDCEGTSGREPCVIWTAKNGTSGLARAGPAGAAPDLQIETRAWDYSTGGTWPGSGTAGKLGKECDQIEVTVKYRHKFVLPVMQAMAPNGVELVGRQRMTNEPYAPCAYNDGVG
jgi:hypothetical protein